MNQSYIRIIIINNNNHPHPNQAIIRQQGRTMQPPIATLGVVFRHPPDPRRHAAADHHGFVEAITFWRCADAGEEGCLQDTGDAEGGGGEEDAEGWVWSD